MPLPKNETTVNLKSASFVVIMHLNEGWTHIQSQIKPRMLFGESFTLMKLGSFKLFNSTVLFTLWMELITFFFTSSIKEVTYESLSLCRLVCQQDYT